eukprot:jgi/Bigna1/69859/fgenesh1_pg.10_\
MFTHYRFQADPKESDWQKTKPMPSLLQGGMPKINPNALPTSRYVGNLLLRPKYQYLSNNRPFIEVPPNFTVDGSVTPSSKQTLPVNPRLIEAYNSAVEETKIRKAMDTYTMECKFDSTKNRNKYYGVLPPPCNRESLFFSMPILKDKTIIGNAVCDSSNRWIKRDGILFDTVIDNQEIIKNKYVFDVENATEPGMMGSGLGLATDYRKSLGALGAIGAATMLAPGLIPGAIGYGVSGLKNAGSYLLGKAVPAAAAGAASQAAAPVATPETWAQFGSRKMNNVFDRLADATIANSVNQGVNQMMQQPQQMQQQSMTLQQLRQMPLEDVRKLVMQQPRMTDQQLRQLSQILPMQQQN